MRALEGPLPRARPGLLHGTPVAALVVLAAIWVMAIATLPEAAVRVAGLAVAHGALLGTALAWTSTGGERDSWAPLEAGLVLGGAATCASLHPWGSLAYVAVPAWLAWRRAAWLGARAWQSAPAVAGGALFGLLLGAHLLVNTALTFGYRVRTGPLVSSPRGGRMTSAPTSSPPRRSSGPRCSSAPIAAGHSRRPWRWRRARPFCATSPTRCCPTRSAWPPAPPSISRCSGAGSCWFFARTGSLGPSLAAATVFFGAYRLLAPR